jgi:hypothetical protein
MPPDDRESNEFGDKLDAETEAEIREILSTDTPLDRSQRDDDHAPAGGLPNRFGLEGTSGDEQGTGGPQSRPGDGSSGTKRDTHSTPEDTDMGTVYGWVWTKSVRLGIVQWFATLLMALLAMSYSIGRIELIESEFQTTPAVMGGFWYLLDLNFVPLSVRGTVVNYGALIRETQRLPGFGTGVGGPIVTDMTLAVSGVGTHTLVLAGLLWGGWRASGILTDDEPTLTQCVMAGASTAAGFAPLMIVFGLVFASLMTPQGRIGPEITRLIQNSVLLPVIMGAIGGWLHAPSDWIEVYVGESDED